jgi:hypothetical protein
MGRGMSSAGHLWKKMGAVVKRAWQADQDAPMRILICSNLFPPHVMGGAEMVAYRQAKVLQEWGHDVCIFCGRFGDATTQPYQIMDLSDEAILDRGKLLLIASAGQNALSHALRAFERQIPIVACGNVRELMGLCLASNDGLFYEDLNELQDCLALLLSDEPLRQAMGMNGWNFVKSFKHATARSSKSGVCRLGSLWKGHNGRTGQSRSVAVDTEGERPCTSASG